MKKKQIIKTPYAKENNLLQLSLFYFGKKRPMPREVISKWEDEKGNKYSLSCSCKHGVPSSFEQDVYTACMRLWVKQGMENRQIKVTYSEIAKELGLNPQGWVTPIKKSLMKLGQARYHFEKCFIVADEKGNKKMDAYFSLFDTALLFSKKKGGSTRNGESVLTFPEEIQKNLEAKYYQFLCMDTYKSLPSGLARRLYEYLAKRRYHGVNGVFIIAEMSLCRWLPIEDKNTTNRRKRIAKTANSLIEIGYLSYYEFDKEKKQCIFTYAKNATQQQETIMESAVEVVEKKIFPRMSERIKADSSQKEIIALVKLKRISNSLRKIISDNISKHGGEYVKRNILYANQNAKRNYSTYLQKALVNDWGKVWAEEQEIKQGTIEQEQAFDPDEAIRQAKQHQQREEETRRKREQELVRQIAEFKAKVAALGPILRDGIKKKAEQETPTNCPPQALRGKYSMLLLDAVNQMGSNFSSEVLSPALAKELWEIK